MWHDIISVFTPDAEITDARDLHAREEQLKSLLKAYALPTSVPLIVGPPGVGKTSLLNVFGQMVAGVSAGTLSESLDFYLPPARNRLVISCQCKPQFDSAEVLAAEILHRFNELLDERPKERRFIARDFSVTSSVPLIEIAASWQRAETEKERAVDRLAAILEADVDAHQREVVIILDECETLPWLNDLLNFVRRFDRLDVRFILSLRDYAAGVLRRGQHATNRAPVAVKVRGFGENEVVEFYVKIQDALASKGVIWALDPVVMRRLQHSSAGEPWYLQMMGHELVQRHSDVIAEARRIDAQADISSSSLDFDEAERAMLSSRLEAVHVETYRDLITRRSKAREDLLQSLALFPETIIPDSFVAHLDRLRHGNVRKVIEGILRRGPVPVLVESSSVPRGLEFTDHQFRIYCRLGDLVHPGARLFGRECVESWLDQSETHVRW